MSIIPGEEELRQRVEELTQSRANCAFLVGQLLGQVNHLKFILQDESLAEDTKNMIALAMVKAIIVEAQPIVRREFFGSQYSPEPPDILK